MDSGYMHVLDLIRWIDGAYLELGIIKHRWTDVLCFY
jgi:hypothetical protein